VGQAPASGGLGLAPPLYRRPEKPPQAETLPHKEMVKKHNCRRVFQFGPPRRNTAQAEGEQVQESCSAAMGTEVSWSHRQNESRTKAARSAKGGAAIQRAGSGNSRAGQGVLARDVWRKNWPGISRARSSTREVRRLWCARPSEVDQTDAAVCDLEAAGNRARCDSPHSSNVATKNGGQRLCPRCPMLTSTRSGFRD